MLFEGLTIEAGIEALGGAEAVDDGISFKLDAQSPFVCDYRSLYERVWEILEADEFLVISRALFGYYVDAHSSHGMPAKLREDPAALAAYIEDLKSELYELGSSYVKSRETFFAGLYQKLKAVLGKEAFGANLLFYELVLNAIEHGTQWCENSMVKINLIRSEVGFLVSIVHGVDDGADAAQLKEKARGATEKLRDIHERYLTQRGGGLAMVDDELYPVNYFDGDDGTLTTLLLLMREDRLCDWIDEMEGITSE
jgi:hypothetical protein